MTHVLQSGGAIDVVGVNSDAAPSGAAVLRTSEDYLREIKDDGRRVFIDNELVTDVTSHPAFRNAARSIASIFDLIADPANRELMTFASPKTGQPVSRIWQMPRSYEDLVARRRALKKISELTLGFMGRSPDHVSSFFAGFAMRPDVFARGGQQYADNMVNLFDRLRDTHRYVTYTIVPPQIDRTKPAHQQSPSDLYAGVVKERDDGLVIKGAQMLGTGTVFSDYVHLSTIHPMKPGDENFAISVVIPCNAPGVKIMSRRSYASAATSIFDYPLASRFDETDSLLVYDNVFVPWEDVIVYRNLDVVRAQWFEAPAHIMGNSQAQIRFSTKLQFLLGLARRITEMTGAFQQPPVQTQIGQLATYAAMYEGLIYGAEANFQKLDNGYVVPGTSETYANMNLQSEIYPKMLEIVRELCGGGLIQLPSSAADFDHPEMGEDIRRYIQSPDMPAEDRVKLMKLAWDMIGSEFAGRHEQYEKFYAGAPFIVKGHMLRNYDFKKAGELVDSALAGYDRSGCKCSASMKAACSALGGCK
jgi:4-hydroxyphenylacetate 3-monooxygenase